LEESFCSSYKVCSSLKEGEKCFRLLEYDEGEYRDLFHEHVPNFRISGVSSGSFMKSLIISHSSLNDEQIFRTYLNKRGNQPSMISLLQGHIETPEPGVLRKYADSGQLVAWYDEVISPSEFRMSK